MRALKRFIGVGLFLCSSVSVAEMGLNVKEYTGNLAERFGKHGVLVVNHTEELFSLFTSVFVDKPFIIEPRASAWIPCGGSDFNGYVVGEHENISGIDVSCGNRMELD